MKRKFPTRPIMGVGAVLWRGDSVLLIRRGHPPMQGKWTIPGGVVEVGETLAEAAQREILEETGLRITVGPLIELFDRIQRAGKRVQYHYIIADFLGTNIRGTLRAASDVREARFVPRAQLSRYGLTPVARRVIRRAFRMRKQTS
ncbi:MAG: NUDIX hydrolase [Acidobacteriia bacterium]|nr:NUDIX hydrolase [Terriglobia bacterium]